MRLFKVMIVHGYQVPIRRISVLERLFLFKITQTEFVAPLVSNSLKIIYFYKAFCSSFATSTKIK